MIELTGPFARANSLSFLPSVLLLVYRNYAAAVGHSRLGLATILIGIVVNAIIFTLVQRRSELALKWKHLAGREITKPLWRIGTPIGFSGLGSVGTFVGMTFIIALMGSEQVVGHAIGLQAANVGFAILWGGAQATTISIGRATGARNLAATQTAAWTGVANGVATAVILSTTFLVLRDQIVGLFLDYEVAANAASIEAALSVMLAIGIYQLANGPQLVATSSLRGLRDTTVPFVISLTGYWVVGASFAAILLRFTEPQAEGIWFAMSAAVAISSAILLYRLSRLLPRALELTSET